MRSLSLDAYYQLIKGDLNVVQSYTETSNVSYILRGCRLRPIQLYNYKDTYNVKMYYDWYDEYRSVLRITGKKKERFIITHNSLTIEPERLLATDIYGLLSITKLAKISKLLFFMSGKDDNYPISMVSFLGIDNYFRTFLYEEDKFVRCSSLGLGIEVLKLMADNQDLKYFLPVSLKTKKFLLPCQVEHAWLTSLPVPLVCKQEISQLYPYFNFILGE